MIRPLEALLYNSLALGTSMMAKGDMAKAHMDDMQVSCRIISSAAVWMGPSRFGRPWTLQLLVQSLTKHPSTATPHQRMGVRYGYPPLGTCSSVS